MRTSILLKFIFSILLLFPTGLDTYAAEAADSLILESVDSLSSVSSNKGWIRQLINTGFHINDPSIRYPAFAKWLVNVYNWGDKTFNSYDEDYVVGTGKNWKAYMKNDMWMRTYVMHFRDNSLLHISSKLYDDMGFNLCFMALSLGYTFKVNDWFGDKNVRHRLDFSFTSSLFSASFSQQKVQGGAIIRKFGDFMNGKRLNYEFSDINVDNTNFDIYYFFNHRKYSQAAAYCYSKYQLKSAGSWVLGFNYLRQAIDMDFSKLPSYMLDALPSLERRYNFYHTDYNILWGYAHNWVIKPRVWLINLTVLPSIGYKHTSVLSSSIRDLLSTNIEGLGAVVYNHDSLFATLSGRFNGYLNFGKSYTFFNSTQILTASVGVRF